LAPSNFSENRRTTIESELLLYANDVSKYIAILDSNHPLVFIKPHPYGSFKKYKLLAAMLSARYPQVSIFLEKKDTVILEQYLAFGQAQLSSISPSSVLHLLAYQTCWPTISALGLNVQIKVGFSGTEYQKLFHSHSAVRRTLFQDAIPSTLRLV
jgi:hypothetical protein